MYRRTQRQGHQAVKGARVQFARKLAQPFKSLTNLRRCAATMIMGMRITTTMLVLAALLLSVAASTAAAARPLDSSGWPQEALAALEASCDGCFDPMAAVEVSKTRSTVSCMQAMTAALHEKRATRRFKEACQLCVLSAAVAGP